MEHIKVSDGACRAKIESLRKQLAKLTNYDNSNTSLVNHLKKTLQYFSAKQESNLSGLSNLEQFDPVPEESEENVNYVQGLLEKHIAKQSGQTEELQRQIRQI